MIRSRWYACAAELFETYDALVLPTAQVWPFPADWRYPQEIAGVQMDSYHRWMEAMVPLLLIGFLSVGLAYGIGAGTIRNDRDAVLQARNREVTGILRSKLL